MKTVEITYMPAGDVSCLLTPARPLGDKIRTMYETGVDITESTPPSFDLDDDDDVDPLSNFRTDKFDIMEQLAAEGQIPVVKSKPVDTPVDTPVDIPVDTPIESPKG